MNKFGQKIRDCGHPRISSARPGAAMASVRNWAVPAVMAAALILSGCQTLDPDSAEGESNSLLKAIAVAFVGGAAVWGGSGGGGSDDRPLLTPRTVVVAGAFSAAVAVTETGQVVTREETGQAVTREETGQVVQYLIDTPSLDRAAGSDGFPLGIQIPIDFTLAPEIGTCNNVGRCVVTIPVGQRAQRLILVPPPTHGADDLPPLVSLIRSNNYDILPTFGFFTAAMRVTQGGRATFTIISNTPVPSDMAVMVNIDREGFGFDESDTGRLAAIAAIVGRQANHIPCDGSICTVTIPEGEISATFRLIPQGLATDADIRWIVSLMPAGTNDPFEIENGNRGAPPIEVANTPTGVRGEFSEPETVDADLRRVSVQTPDLDRAAGPDGFNIDFTPPENFRPVADQMVVVDGVLVPVMVTCEPDNPTACRVTIPENMLSLPIIFEPVPMVVVVDPTETGFTGTFTFTDPDAMTGEITVTTPMLDADAPSPRDFEFTLEDNFMPVSGQTGVSCTDNVCTVTIPTGSRSLAVRIVPTPISQTNPVDEMVGLAPTDDYTLLPEFFVGFSTLVEPTRNPDNGEVTFTFVSDTAAPVGGEGVAVSFRITGDDFTAMLTDDTPLVCQGNVCTVVIPAGSDRVAFVLVPQRPDTTNWRVAIVPDTNDNYGIDDDSQTPVAVTTTPPPDFVVGFDTSAEPTVDPDNGNVTFTFVSETVAPVGGLEVNFRITGDAFTAMLPGGTALDCPLNVCTVRIPAGSDTAEFILVPQGPDTTWRVAIVPDTTNNYGFNDDSQTSVAVTTLPTPDFVVGFSTPQPTVDTDTGNVTFTFVSDTAAPVGGFAVSITITGSDFMAMRPDGTPLVCPQDVCTVTILEGRDTAALILVPQGTATTNWEVAIVPDTNNNYGINVNSQAPVDVATTPPPDFVVGFSTPLPTTDPDTGEVTFTVVSDTPALVGGLEVSITIGGDAFIAIPLNADGTRMNTPLVCSLQNVCTITILEGSDTAAFVLVPQGTATTRWSVAIVDVEDTSNIYGINENSRTPVAVTTTPPAVGFSTPQPTVEQNTGNVTFTVESNVDAPVGGFDVSISIEGEGFTAMLLNADGTRTPANCQGNVCTVTIEEGTRTAAFILIPLGPSDLDLMRWTVTIVDDPSNNYAIVADSQASVIVGEITLIADGEADFTLDRNARVRFSDLSPSFGAFGLDGALPDVLEIPSAPRVLADSQANPFASGYGYFADDGGFLPVGTDTQVEVPPTLPPPNLGPTDQISGQVDITLPLLDAPAGSGGFDIEFTVSGSNDFTATLLDAVDPADRTSVQCPGNICTVTIPEGETGLPSSGNRVVLTPTVPPSILNNIPAPNWMVMINTMDPILPDPLSVNRANNDEAVFYARRGNQLVARFHTTGTFTNTAQVDTLTFRPFAGTDSLPPFVRIPFDPVPFGPMRNCGSLSGSDLTACNDFNSDLTNLVNSERNAHNTRQDQLQGFYTAFGTNEMGTDREDDDVAVANIYNNFLDQVCDDAEDASMCERTFSDENEVTFLVVDGFGGIGVPFRGDLALSEGDPVVINRPVAIALAITSTLVAAEDDVQELVYSYLVDADGDDAIDVDGNGFDVINTDTIGSALNFALYQSGDIPNPLPPSDAFSISQIDSSRELLGRSNVRTFLYENEFSAIGAWLIPPTAEEINADADAAYYAAAAHWFGFETPADRIPTTDRAVYGGIATGDFRQVRFRFADTDNDPDTPLDETITNVESYYVHGNAQFDADFATSEMDGEFSLFAFNPQDVYGDPTLVFARPLDLLVVNWEGQILPDSGAFANNFRRVLEPRVDAMGNIIYRTDPVTNLILTDPITGDQLPETREVIAPAGTLQQPLRVEAVPADLMDPENSPAFGREPVFDNLVDIGTDNPFIGIGGVDPSRPAPIGSETLFSVFGKFFGPGTGAFPEEVAGELRIFNSRTSQLTPPMLDSSGDPIRNTGTSESVTSSLEVHFTADGAPVPDDRFEESP